MSQNPVYEGEDGQYTDMYAEKQPQQFDNMASYRQATTGNGPPSHTAGAMPPGKSYRFATDAIPEGEDEEAPGYDHPDVADSRRPDLFQNKKSHGNGNSANMSAEKQGFCAKHIKHILIGLVILFALLTVIFLALYAAEKTREADSTLRAPGPIKENPSTDEPVAVTTPKPKLNSTRVGQASDNADVFSYTMKNDNGMRIEVLNIGARINKLITPQGTDIILGFNTDNYNTTNVEASTYGSASGRVCGSIVGNSFNFDGGSFSGESDYLHKKVFDVVEESSNEYKIVFTTTVDNADDGLPGSVSITVTYSLEKTKNELGVQMMATPQNGNSVIDMCNAVRWNLNGHSASVITNHDIMVPGSHEILQTGIPGDEIRGYAQMSTFTPFQTLLNGYGFVSQSAPYDVTLTVDGTTGKKYAGSLRAGGVTVDVFSNQDAIKVMVLQSGPAVEGKATYGPLQSIAFYTHNYPNAVKERQSSVTLDDKPANSYMSDSLYVITSS